MGDVFEDEERDVFVQAGTLDIGEDVSFGRNVDVRVTGRLKIGDRARMGSDLTVRAHEVEIGDDFFHSRGMTIGGGGSNGPDAKVRIGDRCSFHDVFLNVARPVTIGDDVGISPEVSILTHGFYQSVLDGYASHFDGVEIGEYASIGHGATVLMGVEVGAGAVVGASSVVFSDVEPETVVAGNPARFVRKIQAPEPDEKRELLDEMIERYRRVAKHHGISPQVSVDYPKVRVNDCVFDVEAMTFEGEEDEETDDFRDYLRKWGLRFYSDRPFRSAWEW